MRILRCLIVVVLLWAYFGSADANAPVGDTIKSEAVITQTCDVRPLPGGLNDVPVFNSNSPEVIQNEGILLSTFSPAGMKFPNAHLNYSFKTRFDLFFHHISNGVLTGSERTVYVGLIANNPNNDNVKLTVLNDLTYLSQPDAPFISLSPAVDNAKGEIYAGPGDRVMTEILDQALRPANDRERLRKLFIPAHKNILLAVLPIPVKGLSPPINGRSGLFQLACSQPVHIATVALFARTNVDGSESPPIMADWESALDNLDLVHPREKAATAPGTPGNVVYGRVAGVSVGSEWRGKVTDNPTSDSLSLKLGQSISYPICSLEKGTFHTGQIQSAPLAVRYPDTAYLGNGNYGVHYALDIPIENSADMEAVILLLLQTPLKADTSTSELKFYETPPTRVFFRGTVRARYKDDDGREQEKYTHLVQNRGDRSSPIVQLLLKSHERRSIHVDFSLSTRCDTTPGSND